MKKIVNIRTNEEFGVIFSEKGFVIYGGEYTEFETAKAIAIDNTVRPIFSDETGVPVLTFKNYLAQNAIWCTSFKSLTDGEEYRIERD